MKHSINEIKTQAKKLLKAYQSNPSVKSSLEKSLRVTSLPSTQEIQLKHCLHIIAQQLGFTHWHVAQQVFSGTQPSIEQHNMGTFFYPTNSIGFINEWFSTYQQAQQHLHKCDNTKWLLPYKTQFLVVGRDFINVFGITKPLHTL